MRWVLVLILIISLVGCKATTREEVKMNFETLNLKTEDNINIKADYYNNEGNKGIILLHMLRKDKTSWRYFSDKLSNYKLIAVDLRGHGESDLNWNDFSEKDFNNMKLDVKAAQEFLKSKNVTEIAVIGASIGANTALNFAVENNLNVVVLLSPGLDYRGVKTEESIKQYKGKILVVTAEKDDYSFESSSTLKELNNNVELVVIEGSKHGTDMLDEVGDKLVSFLEDEF